MRHTYEPGEWMAVVAERGAALLPATAPVTVCTAVLEHLASGTGLGPFVDALTTTFGSSLSGIPDFAVAMVEGDGVRIAVRGPVAVVVTTGNSAVPLTGAGVSTWTETVIAAAQRVELAAPERSPEGAASLPLSVGVARASAVTFYADAQAAPAPPVEVAPPVELPIPAEAAHGEDSPLVHAEPSGETTLHAQIDDEPLDNTFGDLWGATQMDQPSSHAATQSEPEAPTAQNAEPEPPAEPAAASESSAPAPGPQPAPVETTSPSPPPAMVEPETPQVNGMIAGVPSQWNTPAAGGAAPPPSAALHTNAPPAQTSATPEAAPAPAGDHDGETVSVGAAREMAAAMAPQFASAAPAAPTPAPPRGRVKISTGGEYALDRNVIVGRRPKATRITGVMPHLVAVASPEQDISRSHLEVRVEGDSVVAVDLNTTNGSIMHRGGNEPMRLHPNEPMVMVSGDVIDIGDGVSITFEDLP